MKRRGGNRSVPPPGRGGLSEEDVDLWSRTAQTLEPLRRGKPRVTPGDPVETMPSKPAAAPAQRVARTAPAARAPATQAPPPLAAFDPRTLRRIARGRSEIDARIDLHGLRQSEAHHRLSAFMRAAYAGGLRCVLVITGKGGGAQHEDADGRRSERGVIRRSVPAWLAEPELRAIVVSFTQAHARHGGDGALYVYLRRRRAEGAPRKG